LYANKQNILTAMFFTLSSGRLFANDLLILQLFQLNELGRRGELMFVPGRKVIFTVTLFFLFSIIDENV